MLSIVNNRIVAKGAHSSSLTKVKVGGGSRGRRGGSGITRGMGYLFWYPFISGEGGRGGVDGIGVVRGWLLTLLTTRLGVRLVFHRKVIVSTDITTH